MQNYSIWCKKNKQISCAIKCIKNHNNKAKDTSYTII